MRRLFAALLAGVATLALAAAACTTADPRAAAPQQASPFQPCPPSSGTGTDQPASGADAGPRLPEVSLPCAAGGAPVDLADLGHAAVINLWASWCAPCRRELPEFQRLANAAGAKLMVLGVVTADTTASANALGTDLGITFPMAIDDSAWLRRSLAQVGLPVTLFVDPSGTVRHVEKGGGLTLSDLVDLTREHLGVLIS